MAVLVFGAGADSRWHFKSMVFRLVLSAHGTTTSLAADSCACMFPVVLPLPMYCVRFCRVRLLSPASASAGVGAGVGTAVAASAAAAAAAAAAADAAADAVNTVENENRGCGGASYTLHP